MHLRSLDSQLSVNQDSPMKMRFCSVGVLFGSLLASTGVVEAGPVLSVEAFDGTVAAGNHLNLTTASDPTTGAVTAFNSNLSLLVLGQGIPSNTGLALSTLNASNATASGVLTIVLSQTGVTATQATQPFAISFTGNMLTANSSASLIFSDYISASNAPLDTKPSDLLASSSFGVSSAPTLAYSTTASASGLTVGGLYSQTEVIQITFNSSGSISASSQLLPNAVPEPASIALLGSGLFALGMFTRKRRLTQA